MREKTIGRLRRVAGAVKEQWSPRRGIALGTGILLLGASFAGGYATNAPALAEARADVAWQTELADRYRQSRIDAEAEWEESYMSLQDDMTDLRTSTAERSADLQAREEALVEAEEVAASRSFAGGQILVGDQVEAGTYRTGPLTDSCYYAWMSGTSSRAVAVPGRRSIDPVAGVRRARLESDRRCWLWSTAGQRECRCGSSGWLRQPARAVDRRRDVRNHWVGVTMRWAERYRPRSGE